ncbi:hypothetical protein VNI00_001397 [Paramarasmius palmivorus]|uniref:DNA mismatch repair proteins mutS family domain-containing protein n=1 Tax=Paramarasmius palmivorus TaxID=297713 RepID=A0AAW0E5C4_9AGAR
MVKLTINTLKPLSRSFFYRRAFHGTSLLRQQSLDTTVSQDIDTRTKVTKTKKSYSELPRHHINADGTVAKPLEEWWDAGEEQSVREVRYVNIKALSTTRRAKAKSSIDTGEGATAEDEKVGVRSQSNSSPQTDDTEVKPKRRRRVQKDTETEPGSDESTKPKRRRRTIKGEATTDDPAPRKRRKATAKPKKDNAPDLEEVEDFDDGQPRSTLAKEITENLSKFPHCILLTRVGNFYESYFDQAKEVASLLNIKLASRRWGGGRVAMCGFPLQHIDKHLKILVQQNNRFVAMCEEFPRYLSAGKREFERRVARVITPGTLIDESFLNQYENNYLLSISAPQKPGDNTLGLAWIDVSTGEFYSKPATYDTLRDEIARIGPREVVLDKSLEADTSSPILDATAEEHNTVSFISPSTPTNDNETVSASGDTYTSSAESSVTDEITSSPSATPDVYSPEESAAIKLLTTYLQANLLEHMPQLRLPSREENEGRMQIDSHTIKALEIRESMREGTTKGSLMNVIKRTTTTSGTRLLSRWLCSPSTSITEINARQSLVAFFCERPHFRSDLLVLLTKAEDAGRIVQKFVLGKGEPNDLLALASAIRTWSSVVEKVKLERDMEARERQNFSVSEWISMNGLMSRVVGLDDLAQRIGTAIVKYDGPTEQAISEDDLATDSGADALSVNRFDWRFGRSRFGVKINPEFSEDLKSIHTTLQDLLAKKEKLEERLQLTYDAPSLSLRSSPAQGMHVHLGKSKRDQSKLKNDPAFVPISESGTTKCYFYQEWSQLGSQIFDTAMNFAIAEREAFDALRQEITSHASSLRRNARILDELDVTLAFASLATEMKFVRPILLEDNTDYKVVNGRHPTVELGLLTSGRMFTPNDVDLTPTSKLHVITGPNMAGKSTLLRQTALITILAQTGSFVPADAATLGIVDKLFSRVGAKDDLFHDRSTFMVEMLETAEILRRATPRSLVIMDEVGRGTTVNDGLAIAFATVHHLVSVNQCRALFATHFHELSDMLGYTPAGQGQGVFNNVSFYCTGVDELEDGSFTYSYRVRRGVNRDSHGLKVAQLAGMPEAAVSVARHVLDALRAKKAQEYDSGALEHLGKSAMNKHHSPSHS